MKRTPLKRGTKQLKRSPLKKVSKNKKTYSNKRMIYGIKVWSIKIADNNFSKYIREKNNYTCEKCGYHEDPPTWHLQCSHYIGRSEMATRFLELNCDCLCSTCHALFENRKQYEYRDWKINKIGIEAEKELGRLKNTTLGEKDAIYNCMKLLGKLANQPPQE